MSRPNRLAAWKALAAHREALAGLDLRRAFTDDPRRGERLACEAAGMDCQPVTGGSPGLCC